MVTFCLTVCDPHYIFIFFIIKNAMIKVLKFHYTNLGGDTHTTMLVWKSLGDTQLSVQRSRDQAYVLNFGSKSLSYRAILLALLLVRMSLRKVQIRYHNLMTGVSVNQSLTKRFCASFYVNICYFKKQYKFSKVSITCPLKEALLISGKGYNLFVTQTLHLKIPVSQVCGLDGPIRVKLWLNFDNFSWLVRLI